MTSWLLVLCLVLWMITKASELVMSCIFLKLSRKQKQTNKKNYKKKKKQLPCEGVYSPAVWTLCHCLGILLCSVTLSYFPCPVCPPVPPLYVSPHALVSSCFSIIYLFISSCLTLFFLTSWFAFTSCYSFPLVWLSASPSSFSPVADYLLLCLIPPPVTAQTVLFMTLCLTLVFVLPLWLCLSMRSFCR